MTANDEGRGHVVQNPSKEVSIQTDELNKRIFDLASEIEKLKKPSDLEFLQKILNKLTFIFIALYLFGLFITAMVGGGTVNINLGGKPTINNQPKPTGELSEPLRQFVFANTGLPVPKYDSLPLFKDDVATRLAQSTGTPPQPGTPVIVNVPASGGEKSDNPNSTFVKDIMLPLLGALVIWLVAATGLERLKSYDGQFEIARKENREILAGLRTELRVESAAEQEKIDASVEKARKDILDSSQSTQGKIEDYQKKISEELNTKLNGLDKKISEFEASIANQSHETLSAFGHQREALENEIREKNDQSIKKSIEDIQAYVTRILGKIPQIEDEELRDRIVGGSITSLGQLHDQIQKLEGHEDKLKDMVRIVDICLQDSRISGAAVDYFNISAVLGRSDQETTALRACEAGLEKFPSDIDLLSHALQFSSKLGLFSKAETFYRRAREIGAKSAEAETERLATDFTQWNWRAFIFAQDYLEAVGRWDLAVDLAKKQIETHPNEEEGYSQLVGFYLKRNKENQVKDIVGKVDKAGIRAPRMYMQLARDAQESGANDDAIKYTSRGLMHSAEGQASVSQSALWFYRAAAFDAKFVDQLTDGPNASRNKGRDFRSEVLDLYRKAVNAYVTSSGLQGSQRLFRSQADQRVKIMDALLQEAGIERPTDPRREAREQQERQKMAMLAQLFAQAKAAPHGSEDKGDEDDKTN